MSSLSLDVRASKQPVALFALSLVVGTITSAYIGMDELAQWLDFGERVLATEGRWRAWQK